MKFYKWIYLVLILLVPVSCHSNVHADLIETGCALPCWNEITPGMTGLDESIAILNKLDGLQNIRQEMNAGTGKVFAYFEDGTSHTGYFMDGLLVSSSLGRGDIWAPRWKSNSTILEDIVASIGYPDRFFLGSFSGGRYPNAFLLYDNLSTVIAIRIKYMPSQQLYLPVKISGRDRVENIYMFDPERFEEEVEVLEETYYLSVPNFWFDWQGYGRYE